MAKKGKTDSDDLDDISLDDMDMGDLGDLDLDDVEFDRKPSNTEQVREALKEAGEGGLKGFIQKAADKALPDNYEYNFREAMDYADIAKEGISEGKSKVERSLYGLGKEVKKILPFQSKMLENFLTRYEEDNARAKEESEESLRNMGISNTLTDIFDKQLEIQKALTAREDAKDAVADKKQLVSTKLHTDLLSNISNQVSQQTAFTTQISKEYYRKNLELQFKTYYVQADLLKTTKESFKAFSVQFDAIAKNTGLPDYVKLSQTERIGEMMRDQLMEAAQRKIFTNNKYVNMVKDRTKRYVSGKVSDLTSGIDTITDAIGNINMLGDESGDRLRALGNILAGMGGTTIGEKIAERIPQSTLNKIKESKAIKSSSNVLSSLATSPMHFFAELRKANEDALSNAELADGPLGGLRSLLHKGLADVLGITNVRDWGGSVKNANIASHNKPAIFDNKVHRSITEVIPMYLARILKENSNLTLMYKEVNDRKVKGLKLNEEQVYNYRTREFMGMGAYKKDITDKYLKVDKSKERLRSLASEVLSGTEHAGKRDSRDKMEKYLTGLSKLELTEEESKLAFTDPTGVKKIASLLNEEGNEDIKAFVSKFEIKNERIKDNLDRRLRDATQSSYALEPVKELFSNASRLAGAKIFTKLTDKQAEVISKAISRFVLNPTDRGGRGTSFGPREAANGELVYSIPKEELTEKIEEILIVFANDCSRVLNSEDYEAKTALGVYFASVNKAVVDGISLDKETFNMLRDLHPGLVASMDLTIENFVEGKLEDHKNLSFGTREVANRVRRGYNKDINAARIAPLDTLAESKIYSVFSSTRAKNKATIEAAKGQGLRAHVRAIMTVASDNITAYSNYSREAAREARKGIEELGSIISDESGKIALKATIASTGKILNSIDKLIKDETSSHTLKIRDLEELKTELSQTTAESTNEIDKTIRKTEAIHKANLKALGEVKSELERTYRNLLELQEAHESGQLDGEPTANIAKAVKGLAMGIKQATIRLEETIAPIETQE